MDATPPADRVIAQLQECVGVQSCELNMRLREDLMMDELDFVDLAMGCEDAFAIEIPDDGACKCKTIGDWITMCERLVAAKEKTDAE